jgi:hypothetical protein
MVGHAPLQRDSLGPDPQVELDRVRDGSLQNSKGTLLDEKQLTITGMPARRIVADVPQGGRAQLIVLSSSRIYTVVALVPAGWEETADVKRYLNSFALVSP